MSGISPQLSHYYYFYLQVGKCEQLDLPTKSVFSSDFGHFILPMGQCNFLKANIDKKDAKSSQHLRGEVFPLNFEPGGRFPRPLAFGAHAPASSDDHLDSPLPPLMTTWTRPCLL